MRPRRPLKREDRYVISELAANPAYPDIAGQRPGYIANQLHLFRGGKRGGGSFSHLMAAAAKHLTESEIQALAEYLGHRVDEAGGGTASEDGSLDLLKDGGRDRD